MKPAPTPTVFQNEPTLRLRAQFIHPAGLSENAAHTASAALLQSLRPVWGEGARFEIEVISAIASEVVVSEVGGWTPEAQRARLEASLQAVAHQGPTEGVATLQWIYSLISPDGKVFEGHTLSWHRCRPDPLISQPPRSGQPALYQAAADRQRVKGLMAAAGLALSVPVPAAGAPSGRRPRV